MPRSSSRSSRKVSPHRSASTGRQNSTTRNTAGAVTFAVGNGRSTRRARDIEQRRLSALLGRAEMASRGETGNGRADRYSRSRARDVARVLHMTTCLPIARQGPRAARRRRPPRATARARGTRPRGPACRPRPRRALRHEFVEDRDADTELLGRSFTALFVLQPRQDRQLGPNASLRDMRGHHVGRASSSTLRACSAAMALFEVLVGQANALVFDHEAVDRGRGGLSLNSPGSRSIVIRM